MAGTGSGTAGSGSAGTGTGTAGAGSGTTGAHSTEAGAGRAGAGSGTVGTGNAEAGSGIAAARAHNTGARVGAAGAGLGVVGTGSGMVGTGSGVVGTGSRVVGAGERGRTTVSDRAVRRIAEHAAREALPPGDVGAVNAKVGTRGGRAAVSVALTLPYRAGIAKSGHRVRLHVARRTAALTGLAVARPQVRVRALAPPAGPRPGGPAAPAPHGTTGGPARRPWSERRVPAALAALVGLSACATLLYDVVCVRVAGRTAAPWRSRALTWLSSHGPGGFPVALSAAMAVLGVGMVLLALAPGRRRSLAMSTADGSVRATLDRSAAQTLVRDAVSGVSGVSRVRVRVRRRRRARIRAAVDFGDREVAHGQVVTTVDQALGACGLGRTPRSRVRVRTAPGWHDPGRRDRVSPGSPPRPGSGVS
ncbi:DUF6286 domain-containing Asp23/Gls24 family envelope stress response protein [Streptomyces sp. NPDC004629]|uniref:DUF6286 domain-containing Asp23/Gls24 family envelope stress response protein n=1 Tax=Streptomyces sp. NPDC004629 TaxID=3364705 RepID=UPI0036A25871